MIQRPDGYDQAQPMTGEFQSLEPGGYVCKIQKAKEERSSNGNPMLVLYLDIVEGEYKNFFTDMYRRDTRDDKKWPCIYRQMLINASVGFFKGLVECIEESNHFRWNFDEKELDNKLVGFLFQREEYRKRDGSVGTIVKPYQPRTIQKIREGAFNTPKDKKLADNDRYAAEPDFVPLPDDEDEPLPWEE